MVRAGLPHRRTPVRRLGLPKPERQRRQTGQNLRQVRFQPGSNTPRLRGYMSWTQVVEDNPLLALVLGLTATAISFALGGIIWGFLALYVCVFVGLIAMSYSRSRRKREAAAARAKQAPGSTPPIEFTSRISKPDKQLMDALAALYKSDSPRVRARLEAWVKQAANPDERVERQAQLHYRLYRAGDPTQLDRLKALSAAYPNLAEVTLWRQLASQDHNELWS